ncbi:hypothetical protein NDU88_004998 [Pleurodeles waltl]|uniref:Uncharacterized protein n=1 Tax=Pleurodeles waltl TaxID=8319 RepID=A0AAV7MI60_PLEWA|nr:hypothetical protein NDU88_004998 [Pleurodeles waltl]
MGEQGPAPLRHRSGGVRLRSALDFGAGRRSAPLSRQLRFLVTDASRPGIEAAAALEGSGREKGQAMLQSSSATIAALRLDSCHRGLLGLAPSAGVGPAQAPESEQDNHAIPALLTCVNGGVRISLLALLLRQHQALALIGARLGAGRRSCLVPASVVISID